jgi:hypothetical protein
MGFMAISGVCYNKDHAQRQSVVMLVSFIYLQLQLCPLDAVCRQTAAFAVEFRIQGLFLRNGTISKQQSAVGETQNLHIKSSPFNYANKV